ncbi:hypothetical protein BGX34_006222, partial [Mortierella sp. NVP85]
MSRGLIPKLDDEATLNSVSSKSVEVNEEQQEVDHAADRQDESLKVKRQERTCLGVHDYAPRSSRFLFNIKFSEDKATNATVSKDNSGLFATL